MEGPSALCPGKEMAVQFQPEGVPDILERAQSLCAWTGPCLFGGALDGHSQMKENRVNLLPVDLIYKFLKDFLETEVEWL